MISIVKNSKPDKVYKFSYLKDNTVLITGQGYFIKGKKLYWNDDPIEVKLEALYLEKLESLPADIGFYTEEPITDSLFTILGFKYHKERLTLEIGSYDGDSYWETSIYNPKQILKRLLEILPTSFTYDKDEYGNIHLYYEKPAIEYLTIGEFVQEGINILRRLEKLVSIDLKGFTWKDDYEKDEALFSKEIVLPLLRKMNSKKIYYSHGQDEYGKDFIFSEIDKFGNYINYGMQVKAGDINGKVNGQIDELIGQLDDAFKMPFKRANELPSFISFFYIVISGRFTENAKEKLKNKVSRQLIGSVYILDKERIMELLAKY